MHVLTIIRASIQIVIIVHEIYNKCHYEPSIQLSVTNNRIYKVKLVVTLENKVLSSMKAVNLVQRESHNESLHERYRGDFDHVSADKAFRTTKNLEGFSRLCEES